MDYRKYYINLLKDYSKMNRNWAIISIFGFIIGLTSGINLVMFNITLTLINFLMLLVYWIFILTRE